MQFLIDNIFLIAVALVSGGMLAWPLLRGRSGGAALSTLQATQLINAKSVQVVDVRKPEEFAQGSLPNAKNLPATALKERLGELKKDRPVLVVCNTGSVSGSTVALLRRMGFAEAFTLAGGLAAWREAGLPLRK